MADYQPPNWAGKPPAGLHLDVYKGDQLIQKLMADERPCYFFGRNRDHCQFVLDHASCSRVHAALLFHKHLKRSFLVDLGSTHGTFLGTIRLERHKPQPIKVDSMFHFGASTRHFMLREKPPQVLTAGESEGGEDVPEGGFLGVTDVDTALDELTEFNTAHNRRVAPVIDDPSTRTRRKRKALSLRFAEEDTIINPEDVDPSIGRFRNLVQTSVVVGQAKRARVEDGMSSVTSSSQRMVSLPATSPQLAQLYADLPDASLSSFGGVRITPNLAPDVSMEPLQKAETRAVAAPIFATGEAEPVKKKYAKEAWPGRAPSSHPALSSNLLM